VHYDERKAYLVENRLQRRLRELRLAEFDEYITLLKAGGGDDRHEKDRFIDILTTHETFFFRNVPQLNTFLSRAMPDTIETLKRKGEKVARIWSAACSSGEEPYTLAMMIDHEEAVPAGMEARIFATDISADVIKKAEKGVYDKYSIRNTPKEYLTKYFERTAENSYVLSPCIRKGVMLDKVNIAGQSLPIKPHSMDIVFCRNVLIYFDDIVKQKVVAKLAKTLKPDGYLFIGHSESLHRVSDAFELLMEDGIPMYRKKKG